MKKVFILMLMLTNSVLFGHEQNVHRYIVSEAWKLLTHEKPELSNTIMDPWIGSEGNTSYFTSVIAGSHNEDQQDIIWMNCGFNLNFFGIEIVPCVKTTINHFWNADFGDSDPVTIIGNDPNALEKAKHLWYGTHSSLIGISFDQYGVVDKVEHNDLPTLHNTGYVQWLGYWNSIGQYFSKNESKTYSENYRRRVSYDNLGRICHLLADMSVPAHAHNDAHSPVSEDGTDSYEQWMMSNYSSYTWQDALSQGGTLLDITEKEYPIRYLMYVVNQYADFFPSEGDWSGTYYGDDNYNDTYSRDGKTDYYPILNEIFAQLSTPPTGINHSVQASHLMPFAIRATAALLYLFAVETGQYVPPMPSVTVSPTTNNVGTISGTTEIHSSFTIENTGNVYFSGNVKTTNYTYDLDYINTPTVYETQIDFSLSPSQSKTINYRGVVPSYYGPFTETLNITTSIGNRTHTIVGSIALPDFCFGETTALAAIVPYAIGVKNAAKNLQKQFEEMTKGKLVEGYGLTEASPVTHSNLIWGKRKNGSIGIPFPDTEAAIVSEDGTLLEENEIGELIVRGPQVMKGYWKRPEETEKALRDGWLYTGDVGYMDEEGYTFIMDRDKDLILVGGFNVFPRTIEEAINQHPSVEEVTVIGIPDDYLGETPKAFVKLRAVGDPVTEEELLAFIKPKIGKHERPSQIEFRDELPKTMVGKLSKKELVAEEKAIYEAAKLTK